MGFCQKFIALVQGLVENAQSVIHINGAFTKEIELERRVRQGCPIAPLLFALSTQPLMAMLKEGQVNGQIQGTEVGDSMQILEALFADDTDGCKELTRVCRRFIWGVNSEGLDKKALIAWEKLCKRKDERGPRMVSFELQSRTLKMRLVSQLLEGKELDWTHTARTMVEWKI
ncbi:hypothetical protein R1sor_004567 [Riccia sorocarpa]|uniref:Reverse transcriptase domain-containing protein n=1 Tax=Riccia sorocarpa TaxID=122646 RepID=A0ABD3HJ21_9MARC